MLQQIPNPPQYPLKNKCRPPRILPIHFISKKKNSPKKVMNFPGQVFSLGPRFRNLRTQRFQRQSMWDRGGGAVLVSKAVRQCKAQGGGDTFLKKKKNKKKRERSIGFLSWGAGFKVWTAWWRGPFPWREAGAEWRGWTGLFIDFRSMLLGMHVHQRPR